MKILLNAAILSLGILTGCSGGDGGENEPSGGHIQTYRYSGTVATGKAVPATEVLVKCSDGKSYKSKTDSSGKYLLDAGPAPCTFEAKTSEGLVLQSMSSNIPGTVNVTPFTDLGVKWAQSDTTNLSTAKQALMMNLPNWGIDLTEDPFSIPFNADGTGHDKLIEQFVGMANSVPLTGPDSLPNITKLNISIVAQCGEVTSGGALSTNINCQPNELVYQAINDPVVKEYTKLLMEEIDARGGFFEIIADKAIKLSAEKAFKILAGMIIKNQADNLRLGIDKATRGNPTGLKDFVKSKADELMSIKISLEKIKGEAVPFLLEAAVDFFLDDIEKSFVDRIKNDPFALQVVGSVAYGINMYEIRVTEKFIINCMSSPKEFAACVKRPGRAALMPVLETSVEYVTQDILTGIEIWNVNADTRREEALGYLSDDFNKAVAEAKQGLSDLLNSSMPSTDMIGSIDYSFGVAVDLAYSHASSYPKDVNWQITRLTEMRKIYRDAAYLCISKGVDECRSALGINIPVNILDFKASQSFPGMPIEGRVYIQSSDLSMKRIHAGSSENDFYCYFDLDKYLADSLFSFSGQWMNENGKECARLLPSDPGESKAIIFKMEVRDLKGNLSDGGVIKTIQATYKNKIVLPVVINAISTNASFNASVSPQVDQLAYFRVTGSNFPSTLTMAMADCESVQRLSLSSTEAHFQCMPRGNPGPKAVTVKDQTGGKELFSTTVNVQQAIVAPTVTGVITTNASFNASVSPQVDQLAYFRVTGSNFPSTLTMAMADCESVQRLSLSSTEAHFQCMPRGSAGPKAVTVKDKTGGKELFSTTVNVKL
jgi:hypothetical protein